VIARFGLLFLLCSLGCAGVAAPVRRAVERGDISAALRAYHEYTDERGDGDPDLLASVALRVIRDAAASTDFRTRSSGFSALRGLGTNGREVLEILSREEGVVGERALATLFELDGRNGTIPPRLRAALRSRDVERKTAGMVSLRGPSGLRRLIRLTHHNNPQIRTAAARELVRHRGDTPAAQRLAELVSEDTEATVRAAAVMALGAHGHTGAPVLTQALQDADSLVRMSVPSALMAAAPEEAEAVLLPLLVEPPTNLSIECSRVLAGRHTPQAEAYILATLRSATPALRAQAAVAAGQLQESRHNELVVFLADPDPEVSMRIGAVLIRREPHHHEAQEAIRILAARPDGFVAIRALSVLASANDSWSVDRIRGALRASDATVRRIAVTAWPQAIGPLGSDCDPLAPLLVDTDSSVSLLAAVEIVLIAAR
jgi:HEAT repeat protein